MRGEERICAEAFLPIICSRQVLLSEMLVDPNGILRSPIVADGIALVFDQERPPNAYTCF
jgi:hypothetical protein